MRGKKQKNNKINNSVEIKLNNSTDRKKINKEFKSKKDKFKGKKKLKKKAKIKFLEFTKEIFNIILKSLYKKRRIRSSQKVEIILYLSNSI